EEVWLKRNNANLQPRKEPMRNILRFVPPVALAQLAADNIHQPLLASGMRTQLEKRRNPFKGTCGFLILSSYRSSEKSGGSPDGKGGRQESAGEWAKLWYARAD
ncbi:MAG: hypothetical protein ACRD3W_17865, partial [Terriglobales bacterium]